MAGHGQKTDVNVPLMLVIGLLSTMLLVVIVVGTQAWFRYEVGLEAQTKVTQATNWQLEQLQQEQLGNLRGGRWADNERQRATIPIERAMELVAQRYAQDGVRPAQPAAEPPAQPAAQTPTSDGHAG